MIKRLNCWEFKSCGREPGGNKVNELGVCPATTEINFHGVNKGDASGRFCWSVAGTFCKGEVQGSFAKKFTSCIECSFMKEVTKEEGREFKLLLKDLERKF